MTAGTDPVDDPREQVETLFQRRRYEAIAALLSAETRDGGSFLYERMVSHGEADDYRSIVERLADHISASVRRDIEGGKQPQALASQLRAFCFCQLIRASLISAGASVPGDLVVAAVRARYKGRDWKWGLDEAKKFSGDTDKQIRTQIDLLEHIETDTDKLSVQREIINELGGLSQSRGGYQYELAELVAPELSAGFRDDLRQKISVFRDDYAGSRPRSLAAIAPLFPEPTRSEIIDEALSVARAHPNTWAHAITILLILPLVTRDRRQGLWTEFLKAAAEGALGIPNRVTWGELTLLAAVDELGPRHFLLLVDAATEDPGKPGRGAQLSVRARDELIVDYACRLAERKRFGAAYEAYRAISTSEARLAAQVRALPLIEPRWLAILARLPDPPPPSAQLMRRMFGVGWRKLPARRLRRLHEDLLGRVLAMDDPDVQDSLLAALYPHLTGAPSRHVLGILRENADNQSERAQRASRLADLALISPQDAAELLDQAFALTSIADEPERVAVLAACDQVLDPPEPPVPTEETLRNLVDLEPAEAIPALDSVLGQLPEALIPAAWEAVWSAGSPASLLARLAARMDALGQQELAYGRLRALILGLKPGELTRLLEDLPASLTTVRTYQCILGRWEQPLKHPERESEFWHDLDAIRAVSRRLPSEVIALIVEWCREFRPASTWSGPYRDEIMADLVPLYAQAGYMAEAQEMAASITADQQKAQALAELALHLSDPERASTARQAQALMSVQDADRAWPEWLLQFAEPMRRGTGRQHISEVVEADPDAHTWAMIAVSLPQDEATSIWAEAVQQIEGDEIADLIDRMPDTVTRDALERIATISADNYPDDKASLLPHAFSRIAERGPLQQVKYLMIYLHASASLGRPAFLRSLRELLPVLRELGGDDVLTQLRSSVERVGRWWA
jgi:hypothetical protein